MQNSASPIIKTQNLSVIYDYNKPSETVAIEDINIEIYPEEYVVIFGPSGSGKSTLLYSLTGMEKPTHGEVFIRGQNLATLNQAELARFTRRNVGFVFQAYNLIPTLNVINNVALPQVFEGQMKYTRLEAAKKLLTRFGVEAHVNKLPQEMSGGQQQRVAIARSLINNPSIIFADEPVGNLDSRSAENVLEILMELNQKDKKTIILVTHEPRYLTYAHRVLYVRDGKLIKEVQNPQREPLAVKKEKLPEITKEDIKATSYFYPELPEADVKSKALTEYILNEFKEEQKKRLEEIIAGRIGGKLETNNFIAMLAKPLLEGGAGMPIEESRAIAKKINAVLEKADFIKEKIREETGQPLKAKVEEMRQYLLKDHTAPLSIPQIQRLDELIENRIKWVVDKDTFARGLYTSFYKGGVGLGYAVAIQMSLKLEAVLVNYIKK